MELITNAVRHLKTGEGRKRGEDILSTDHLRADLRGRSIRGGVVTVIFQGLQFAIQSVATVVLARLLKPSDFGMVAMVTAITGLGQAFADLGLSEATIQRPQVTHEEVSGLFWINVAIGLILMSLTMAAAPGFAWFYGEPRLRNIALVAALAFPVSGLMVQHDALLKRRMRFAATGIRDVVSYAVAVMTAIIMAWHGWGYWAIVGLPLTANIIKLVLSWAMVGWIPGVPKRAVDVGSMVKFGGSVAGSYLVININRSIDNILIGWYWGAHLLGLYSRAYSLLMLPIKQLSIPAASVAVPAFSVIQREPGRFGRYYLRAVNLMLWISAPVVCFLFVSAEPVIVLVLGSQWIAAAPVFRILAISALAQVLLESMIWSLVSRALTGRLLRLVLIGSPVLIASFAVALPFGPKGVALAGSLAFVAGIPWLLRSSFTGTDLELRDLGQAIICPLCVAGGAVLVAEGLQRLVAPGTLWLKLATAALSFLGVYSISVMARPVRQELMEMRKLLDSFRLPWRRAENTAK